MSYYEYKNYDDLLNDISSGSYIVNQPMNSNGKQISFLNKLLEFSNIDQEPKQLVRLNKNSLLASILLYYKKYKLNYFILPLGYKKEYFIRYFNNKKNIKKYSFNILNKKNNSGKITIRYNDLEQFQLISDLLTKN